MTIVSPREWPSRANFSETPPREHGSGANFNESDSWTPSQRNWSAAGQRRGSQAKFGETGHLLSRAVSLDLVQDVRCLI